MLNLWIRVWKASLGGMYCGREGSCVLYGPSAQQLPEVIQLLTHIAHTPALSCDMPRPFTCTCVIIMAVEERLV